MVANNKSLIINYNILTLKPPSFHLQGEPDTVSRNIKTGGGAEGRHPTLWKFAAVPLPKPSVPVSNPIVPFLHSGHVFLL